MPNIIRITMFKIPSEEHQQRLLDAYQKLSLDAVKDSKPYIISLLCRRVTNTDERAQGYTVAAKTEFRDMDDFRFYDVECGAHEVLKREVGSWGEGSVRGMVMVCLEG